MTIIPEWRVILMRNDPGSAEVQQNITQWVNLDKSLFQPTKDDKPARSNMFISFPRDTPDIVVKEKREVWAGWVDPDDQRMDLRLVRRIHPTDGRIYHRGRARLRM
jgi:hypothetical protein